MQTAPLDFRLATRADEELLIALMREFYAEDKIDFDDARVRRGVDALLADPAIELQQLQLTRTGDANMPAARISGNIVMALTAGGHS